VYYSVVIPKNKCIKKKGSCIKPNLTADSLDSLMKEFKDVFEADKITPLTGAPMQIHLKRDDP
jgi:hypothetical protein